ncbi:hypothetical protein KHP62_13520 [Rhodobacteraceae bacterium NNCM2]|nr:hypothetical protein [Coraliihabitans acroporae]
MKWLARRISQIYTFRAMSSRYAILLKHLIVVALTFAMAVSGFAHRIAAKDLDPALFSYVQAGGSSAELCGQVDEAPHEALQSCKACRLAGAAILPGFDPLITMPFAALAAPRIETRCALLPPPQLDHARAVRAPPSA